ncbi:adenine phosphoribosyltransferase [Methylotenera sp.]|uniref:adenine phosphoribosyltransferase n=1 Tax=Methylotenera sp. TaxID=2051956 RepID=UPI002ED81BC1
MPLKSLIRTIPHYPKQGIQFRDITTLLKDPIGFRMVIDAFAQHYATQSIDKIAGIEARGFIVGAALAYKLGVGFVPIRKSGKLPAETIGHDYALEYGADRVEIHTDAITQGERVLLVDDLIATGGTAEASVALLQKLGGVVVGCAFVINLPDLGGAQRLSDAGLVPYSLCEFEGD